MAYTGPVPPTPGQNSTDAQWQSWWNYQTALTNGRYDDERAARQVVLDEQHRQKMAAEAACAAATSKQADALVEAARIHAAAMALPQIHTHTNTPPTDLDLVQRVLPSVVRTGFTGLAAVSKARELVAAIRIYFRG